MLSLDIEYNYILLKEYSLGSIVCVLSMWKVQPKIYLAHHTFNWKYVLCTTSSANTIPMETQINALLHRFASKADPIAFKLLTHLLAQSRTQ